jgi:hypothetical protein
LKSNKKKEKISQYSSTSSLFKNETSRQKGKNSSVKTLKNKKNNDKKKRNQKIKIQKIVVLIILVKQAEIKNRM